MYKPSCCHTTWPWCWTCDGWPDASSFSLWGYLPLNNQRSAETASLQTTILCLLHPHECPHGNTSAMKTHIVFHSFILCSLCFSAQSISSIDSQNLTGGIWRLYYEHLQQLLYKSPKILPSGGYCPSGCFGQLMLIFIQ